MIRCQNKKTARRGQCSQRCAQLDIVTIQTSRLLRQIRPTCPRLPIVAWNRNGLLPIRPSPSQHETQNQGVDQLFHRRQIVGKGRHTSTRRELIVLPNGGVVIDNPGMRELGIESLDLSRSFADIELLIQKCKFNDCKHDGEPDCAVCCAIESGELDLRRLENYRKLQKEARYAGLSSKQIELEKAKRIFSKVGGMKKARKLLKQRKDY